jgi:hypothetical protein
MDILSDAERARLKVPDATQRRQVAGSAARTRAVVGSGHCPERRTMARDEVPNSVALRVFLAEEWTRDPERRAALALAGRSEGRRPEQGRDHSPS